MWCERYKKKGCFLREEEVSNVTHLSGPEDEEKCLLDLGIIELLGDNCFDSVMSRSQNSEWKQ